MEYFSRISWETVLATLDVFVHFLHLARTGAYSFYKGDPGFGFSFKLIWKLLRQVPPISSDDFIWPWQGYLILSWLYTIQLFEALEKVILTSASEACVAPWTSLCDGKTISRVRSAPRRGRSRCRRLQQLEQEQDFKLKIVSVKTFEPACFYFSTCNHKVTMQVFRHRRWPLHKKLILILCY